MSNAVNSLVFDDVLLQYGCAVKTTAAAEVEFAERFAGRPTVLISPFWDGAGSGVGHMETLARVGGGGFDLLSNNGAHNYAVQWLAIGGREGTRAPGPSQLALGDLSIQHGSAQKRQGGGLVVGFEVPYPRLPHVHVSPFWEASGHGVGGAEVIDSVLQTQATFVSGNGAHNYFVNWLAVGSASGAADRTFPLGDDHVIRTGRALKNGVSVNVSLGDTFDMFSAPPTVLVSPSYTQPIGHAETLETVQPGFFTVTSDNRASDYFISWIAIGRAR